MSASDPPKIRRARPERSRRDGWTAERQLRFLEALAGTRSVAKAAAFAGMSRKGAYRFRERRDGALFAALWDRVLAPELPPAEVHSRPATDGRIMRLLGNRRERGDLDHRPVSLMVACRVIGRELCDLRKRACLRIKLARIEGLLSFRATAPRHILRDWMTLLGRPS